MDRELYIDKLPNILTANDIAGHLQCAPQTVFVLFRKKPEHGGIPCVRFGRSVRAKKSDFIAWLEDRKSNFQ